MEKLYTVEPGRNIYKAGKPYIAISREGDTSPTEADKLADTVCAWLNEADALTYYTLIVPFVAEGATEWHPTESTGPFAVLTRGAFRTEAAAHEWARSRLAGHPYSVRFVDGRNVSE